MKVGLAMRAERKVIDKIVDGLKFHSQSRLRASGGSRAVTVCARTLQSDKSAQLFDRFGGVPGFLGCENGDLASTPVQHAVMDCRA